MKKDTPHSWGGLACGDWMEESGGLKDSGSPVCVYERRHTLGVYLTLDARSGSDGWVLRIVSSWSTVASPRFEQPRHCVFISLIVS